MKIRGLESIIVRVPRARPGPPELPVEAQTGGGPVEARGTSRGGNSSRRG
jgi:hypothetical protein